MTNAENILHKSTQKSYLCFWNRFLSVKEIKQYFTVQFKVPSNADILRAHHAIFLPHERLLKTREHSLPSVC